MPIYREKFVKGEALKKLADDIEANQIDMVLMESANKVGTRLINGNPHSFYNTDGTISDIDISYNQEISLKYFGTQLDISPNLHEQVIYGTQFRSLIFSNLYRNGVSISPELEALSSEFVALLRDVINYDRDKLIKDFGLELDSTGRYSFKDKNKQQIHDVILTEMERRGFSQNELDGWTHVIDNEDTFVDLMSNREKVENMLFAIVRNRVVNQKMNGDMMILGASTGFEIKPRKQKDDRWASNMETLKPYKATESGTNNMEVFAPNYFKEFVKRGQTINIKNGSIIDSNGNVVATDPRLTMMIGFRIPTSGTNSIETMTVKDFLPVDAGSAIIVPSELVDKAGSDYDIDKMTVFVPNYYINKDGNPKYIESLDQYDDYANYTKNPVSTYEFEKQIKQNRILEISRTILQHKHTQKNLLEAISIKDLKKHAEDIEELKGDSKTNSMFSPAHLTDLEYQFWTGVGGIGVVALNITNHAKGQMAGLYIEASKEDFILGDVNTMDVNGREVVSISNDLDASGTTYISESLNQVAQAVIDIVKNPFLAGINMNMQTLNVYTLLIRTGMELGTIEYFMSQPILVEYVKELNLNSSSFYKRSPYFQRKSQIFESLISKYSESSTDKLDRKTFSKTDLAKMLSGERNKEWKNDQVRLLKAFKQYDVMANDLTTLIQATTQDTKANRNRTSYTDRRQKLDYAFGLAPKLVGNDLVYTTIGNGKNLFENTFMSAFNDVDNQGKLMFDSMFFVESNGRIADSLQVVRKLILNQPVSNYDKLRAMALYEAGMLNYLLQNIKDTNGISIGSRHKQILHGLDATALRFKNFTAESGNILRRELLTIVEGSKNTKNQVAKTSYLKMFTRNLDAFDTQELVKAFNELKEFNPNLYHDIIDLLILTSGIGVTPITYKNIIPLSDFYDRMISIIKRVDTIDIDFDYMNTMIAKNNWKNNILVPVIDDHPMVGKKFATRLGVVNKLPFGIGKIYSNGRWRLFKAAMGEEGEIWVKVPVANGKDRNMILLSGTISHGGPGDVNYYDDNIPGDADGYTGKITEESITDQLFQQDQNSVIDDEYNSNSIRVIQENTQNPLLNTSNTPRASGQMTFSYGNSKRSDVKSLTTLAAIKNGERTATTRYESDGHIDYWRNLKVGDIVEWVGKNNEKVFVKVTKPLHKLVGSGKTAEQWSKLEGWSVDYFNTKVKPRLGEAWQIEYSPINTTSSQPNSVSSYVNHSGGAKGSDKMWDWTSRLFGNMTHNHYYHGAKTPFGNKLITSSDATEGQQKVTIAARQMGRIEPTHQVRDERLIRNWAQVKYSDAVYAIAEGFYNKGDKMNHDKIAKILQVKGGTGYAVQMAINENKPVYVYSQEEYDWFTYSNGKFVKTEVPILTKNFAGIGTRGLNGLGLGAMLEVYRKTFPDSHLTGMNPLKGVLGDKEWQSMNDDQKVIAFQCNFKI
jgi:hypothetical protein